MNYNKEQLKKKIIYRSNYRGTKEMDILLSTFVKKNINTFTKNQLFNLDELLNCEDEIIYNYVFNNITNESLDKNEIAILLKKSKI